MTAKGPFVLPNTGKRDALVAGIVGLLVLAFVILGILKMSQPVTGNKLTGTVIAKQFTPLKEQQISFSRRRIEGAKELDGEYVLKVHVEARNREYEVPVEKSVYESKKVGDALTFLRPESEQR